MDITNASLSDLQTAAAETDGPDYVVTDRYANYQIDIYNLDDEHNGTYYVLTCVLNNTGLGAYQLLAEVDERVTQYDAILAQTAAMKEESGGSSGS